MLLGFGEPFIVRTKLLDIEMDASLNEDHRFDTIVTRNPVEDGSLYTDHVVLLPVVLELSCRVSDASLSYLTPAVTGKEGRSNQAYYKLVELQRDKEPFSVITGINTYENMLVESISIPRSSKDGYSLRFNMVLTELPIVGNDVDSNRDLIAQDVIHTALGVVNLGSVQKVAIL